MPYCIREYTVYKQTRFFSTHHYRTLCTLLWKVAATYGTAVEVVEWSVFLEGSLGALRARNSCTMLKKASPEVVIRKSDAEKRSSDAHTWGQQ